MLVSNHTMQLLIPFESCAIAVTYNSQEEEFYTGANEKAKRLLPPTFELKRTVTVTVIGNGLKFTERYLTKERADIQLLALAASAGRKAPMFRFEEDQEAVEYERKFRKAMEDAKKAATPAYKGKGGKCNG